MHHDVKKRLGILGRVVQTRNGAVGLGVGIDKENSVAQQSQGGRNVESRRGLPYSSFLVGDGDNQNISSKARAK